MTRGIGVIGASPGQSWAAETHVPAIRALPEFCLAAAEVIAVVVKAPDHAPFVEAALRAGKPVVCEWPLGRNLEETVRLSKLAQDLGVPTAIVLQGRVSPWVAGLRRFLEEGRVGEIRSVSLWAWDMLSTGRISSRNAYMLDPDNGATPLSIVGGHTLDTLFHMVGEPDRMTAVTATTVRRIMAEDGTVVDARNSDQTMLVGTLAGGAAFSAHIRAGAAQDESTRIEIAGSDGFLRVVVRKGYVHWSPFEVSCSSGENPLEELTFPMDGFDPDISASLGVAHNVAYLYRAFGRSLDGKGAVASFSDAVARHEMIARIPNFVG